MASKLDTFSSIVDVLTKGVGGYMAAGSAQKADQAVDQQILMSKLMQQIMTRQTNQQLPLGDDLVRLLRARGAQKTPRIMPTQAAAFDPFKGGRNPRLQAGNPQDPRNPNRFPALLAALQASGAGGGGGLQR
jgi:hypothetical protein